MCAGRCIAGPGKCWSEAGDYGADLGGGCEVLVAAGSPAEAERLGGGFCAGGTSGARGSRPGFAHGSVPFVLPGADAVRPRAAFSRLERAELGELVGGNTAEMRGGAAAEGFVSAEEVF